jgi:hypothetical protein
MTFKHFLRFLSDFIAHNKHGNRRQYNDGLEPMQSINSCSHTPSLIFQALAREPLQAVKLIRLSIAYRNEYDLDRHIYGPPAKATTKEVGIETDSQFESTSKARDSRLMIASPDAMLG